MASINKNLRFRSKQAKKIDQIVVNMMATSFLNKNLLKSARMIYSEE